MDTLFFTLALRLTRGIGDQLTKQLIAHYQSAEAVFDLPLEKLMKVNGIGIKTAEEVHKKSNFGKAEQILKEAKTYETKVLCYLDDDYPQRLKHIDDAPVILYTKGQNQYNHDRVVAIVGTRNATHYGKKVLNQVIPQLKDLNCIMISGLAYGIDIMAHKLCLENEVPTYGVMANSLETVYPSVHKSTAHQMLSKGGLISENPFGTKPDAPKFPARNRIIAGMSDAVIVVEAGDKGGALITARIANSYNKDVFAVPGNVDQAFSRGTNHLIKTHQANLMTSVNDLCYILNWNGKVQKAVDHLKTVELEGQERVIYDVLRNNSPLTLDEIAVHGQLSINQAAVHLLTLEFKRVVKPIQGNSYILEI